MVDLEEKIEYVLAAIFLIALISAGGFGLLQHPIMLISFIFIFGGGLDVIIDRIYNRKSFQKKTKQVNKVVIPKPDNKVVIPKNRKPIE